MQYLRLLAFALVLLLAPATAMSQQIYSEFFVPVPSNWSVAFQGGTDQTKTTELIPNDQTIDNWDDIISVYVVDRDAIDSPTRYFAYTTRNLESECQGASYQVLNEPVEVEPGVIIPDPTKRYALFVTFCPWSDVRFSDAQDDEPYGEIGVYFVMSGNENLFIAKRAWRTAPLEGADLPIPNQELRDETQRMATAVLCAGIADAPADGCENMANDRLRDFIGNGDFVFKTDGNLGQ